MENKTAVEWLESKIIEDLRLDDLLSGYYSKEQYRQFLRDKINHALEIEKEQIIDAYQWGRIDQNNKDKYNRNAYIYYSETYKK